MTSLLPGTHVLISTSAHPGGNRAAPRAVPAIPSLQPQRRPAVTRRLQEPEFTDEPAQFGFGECPAMARLRAVCASAQATQEDVAAILAVAIGVVIALLLGAAAAAVVTRWVRDEAAGQPSKQLARITRALLVMGLTWLVACVAALSVLRSQGTGVGDVLFFLSTTAVTLLSPLCSGLCGYAADLLFWSKRLCAVLRWIRALARDLDHLLTTSERSIPPGPGAGGPPAAPVNRVLKAITSPVAAMVLVAALVGLPVVGRAADLPIYLYPDVSPSARSGDVVHVLKGFTSRLADYDGEDVLIVTLVPFYEDAFMAVATARVAIPGNRIIPCPIAKAPSEIERLSKS